MYHVLYISEIFSMDPLMCPIRTFSTLYTYNVSIAFVQTKCNIRKSFSHWRRLWTRLFIVRHDVSTSECKHVGTTMDFILFYDVLFSPFFSHAPSFFLFLSITSLHWEERAFYHNRNP